MSGTYKATGINLKSSPLGESDRLVTILTREFGLIRVAAPGARKHKSSLSGRSGLFVVNDLLIAKGRTIDKIIQAESLHSYAGLSQDLRKLTASQYLAELVLYQALSEQPQDELFCILVEHLDRLEKLPGSATLASLIHSIFHLLAFAGVAPQVRACCVTQQPLIPDFENPDWRIGFSASAGGTISLNELDRSSSPLEARGGAKTVLVAHAGGAKSLRKPSELRLQLDATELAILQQLDKPDLIQPDGTLYHPQASVSLMPTLQVWLSIERLLRHYAQYHLDRSIRSAALIDTCFLSLPQSPISTHDAIV